MGHVRLRIDHGGAQLLEYLAMFLAGSLGDDMGNSHFDDKHGGENADVHSLANTNGHRFAILDSGLFQRFTVQIFYHKGIIGISPYCLDLVFIFIHCDYFFTCVRKRFDKGRAKTAKADHTK